MTSAEKKRLCMSYQTDFGWHITSKDFWLIWFLQNNLVNFKPKLHFYSPWKQKIFSSLFSGDIEMEDRLKWLITWWHQKLSFPENSCFLRCVFFPSSGDCLDILILKRSTKRNSLSHWSYCCYYYCCFYKKLNLIFGENDHVEGDTCNYFKGPVFYIIFLLQCSLIRCTYPHRLCTKPNGCITGTSIMFTLAHEIDGKSFLFRHGRGQKFTNEYENYSQ